MPTHIVKQGEHVSRIAAEHGFSDFSTIWDHPNNAQLKQQRQNPNVLEPGDDLFIPERELREESGATEKRHRFRCHGTPLELRLRILDFDNQPLADAQCQLVVEGASRNFTTDADGCISQPIPRRTEDATLRFKDPLAPFDSTIAIEIGHLDPVEEVSGQKARLANLGYYFHRDDGRDEERFNYGIQEFQCDHNLKVTGVCGPETQAKLKEIHGC
jgi:Putative peptidoglycan binding domain